MGDVVDSVDSPLLHSRDRSCNPRDEPTGGGECWSCDSVCPRRLRVLVRAPRARATPAPA